MPKKFFFLIFIFFFIYFLFFSYGSTQAQGTCEAGFVMGESDPVVVKNECEARYQPVAKSVTTWTFIIPKAGAECTCIPTSSGITPSKELCTKEFQPCNTDTDCNPNENACSNHRCIDVDPQTIKILPNIGGDPLTKRCLAPGSPYGKQYSKAVIKFYKLNCKSKDDPSFDPNKNTLCSSSVGKTCLGGNGLETAIGCIPTDPTEFVKGFLKFSVAIAGGIALLIMVFGSFKMITSAGNPDSLKEGQEMFTNAIIGLLFIIFSTLLLKIIGVDILELGKFLGF